MRVRRFVFKIVVSSYRSSNTHLKYGKRKLYTVKRILRSRYSEKRRALSEEIYVFTNAGRYFFFGSQNPGGGVVKNFQAAEGLYGKKKNTFFNEKLC